MDPSAATAAAMGIQYDMAGGMAFGDPTMQQQHDGRISYDASDAQMMQQMYPHQFNQHSMPSALLGRKHAPDRRPLRFWQPFNDWWRSELNRLGRRPTSEEIGEWYVEAADTTWGETKPTLQETRVHAKCLRSLPLVRDYFRNYRAKKKAKGSDGSGYDGEDTADGDTEDGTDNGGSSRRQKARAKRARLGGPSNSNPETAGTSGQGMGSGGGNNSDPGAAGLAGAGGYAGLDLLQAYPPQYWEAAQTEEYARQAMLQHMQQVALYQQLAAQQLTGGDIQYNVLQQQQQALDEADPLNAAAAAMAAAKYAGLPDGGGEPMSGAAGDDEHIDHEPLYDMGDTQLRPRRTAQADTATSIAAAQGDAIAEEAVSQQMRDKSASVSCGGTPQRVRSPESEPAAGAAASGAAALQQQQRQQLHLGSKSGEQELQLQAGSEQQGQEFGDQNAGPMDAEGHEAATADEPVAEAPAAALARAAVLKAEDTGMGLGDRDMPQPTTKQQQQQQRAQPQAQEEQQQQLQSASKLRQQLDLRDAAANQDAGAAAIGTGADKASWSQQVQQPLAQSDLQAALFSAAAAAAQGAGVSAAAAAAAHGSTAVSPYIQGTSAAAAVAAAAGGLNLADNPQVRPAVEQEEPHPGAQLPEAAAAALAGTPATIGHHISAVGEHRADTPGADHGLAVSIDVDEAELLNDVEMGGMSHGELVAHIRTVQQELLAKRGLLSRSFEQLRRVQDRLARRERKLAKEQQRCKQYQSAVETWQAAWQAAALPSMDPAAQEGDNGQAGPAQAAHAAAAAAQAGVAAAAAEPQQ